MSRVILRAWALSMVMLLGACAVAQQAFVSPHVLTDSTGNVQGVVWNVSGGQRTIGAPTDPPGFIPFQGLFSLYGNDSVYQWLCKNVNGTPTPTSYDVYSAVKDEGLAWTMSDMIPLMIVLPRCDVDSKDQAGVRVVGRITFKAKEGATLARASQTARRQAIWESAVTSRIGDLPTGNTLKVDEITLRRTSEDSDGDGVPETYYRVSDFGIEVPMTDAPAFQKAFEAALAGTPTDYPVQIDYLDTNGVPLLRFSTVCRIVAAGPANPWLDSSSPNATFRAVLRSINDGKKSMLSIIR